MNKYITALLVVLAATGVEAQTYQSALKAALGNSTLEEFCNHLELKGVETDILSVIEAYKNIHKEDYKEPLTTRIALLDRHNKVFYYNVGKLEKQSKVESIYLPNPSISSAILIRAPSCFIS